MTDYEEFELFIRCYLALWCIGFIIAIIFPPKETPEVKRINDKLFAEGRFDDMI